jgi:hypothetical protein
MTKPPLAMRFRLWIVMACMAFAPIATAVAQPFYSGNPPNTLAPRTALVIGISDYNPLRPLMGNPVNDAQKVAALLQGMGFTVIPSLNENRSALLDRLDQLENAVTQNPGVMLIYYSGHGLSSGGQSYIVPADAKLRRQQDLENWMIPLDQIYGIIDRAKPRQAILVFDACRNDPFNGVPNSVNSESGLRATKIPSSGVYVAYSAIDGRTASNGAGDDSPFTLAFLQFAPTESSLSDVFTRVRERLISPLIQQPSNSLDSFVGHFKFAMTQADYLSEQQYFVRVKMQNISSGYDNFMNTYRSGYFYNMAAGLSAKAKEKEALTVPAGPPPPSVVPTPVVPGQINSDTQLQAVPNPDSGTASVPVTKGTPLAVIGRTDDAFRVALPNGGQGYVPQTAVEVSSIPGQVQTIPLTDNGNLRSTQPVIKAATQAAQQSQTVVVQTTLPGGASSDKATVGLKATLDTVDTLLKSGLPADKVVVSTTLRQGPEFKVRLLNLQD